MWSSLSSCLPFQQFGNRTWSRSDPRTHVGISLDAERPPQLQSVIRELCGLRAAALPAITSRFAGNACTGSIVRRT